MQRKAKESEDAAGKLGAAVRVSAASPRLPQPNQNSFIKTQGRSIPKASHKHISHECNLTHVARLSQQSLRTCTCTNKSHNHTNM